VTIEQVIERFQAYKKVLYSYFGILEVGAQSSFVIWDLRSNN